MFIAQREKPGEKMRMEITKREINDEEGDKRTPPIWQL
jgi:hypothetical protein